MDVRGKVLECSRNRELTMAWLHEIISQHGTLAWQRVNSCKKHVFLDSALREALVKSISKNQRMMNEWSQMETKAMHDGSFIGGRQMLAWVLHWSTLWNTQISKYTLLDLGKLHMGNSFADVETFLQQWDMVLSRLSDTPSETSLRDFLVYYFQRCKALRDVYTWKWVPLPEADKTVTNLRKLWEDQIANWKTQQQERANARGIGGQQAAIAPFGSTGKGNKKDAKQADSQRKGQGKGGKERWHGWKFVPSDKGKGNRPDQFMGPNGEFIDANQWTDSGRNMPAALRKLMPTKGNGKQGNNGAAQPSKGNRGGGKNQNRTERPAAQREPEGKGKGPSKGKGERNKGKGKSKNKHGGKDANSGKNGGGKPSAAPVVQPPPVNPVADDNDLVTRLLRSRPCAHLQAGKICPFGDKCWYNHKGVQPLSEKKLAALSKAAQAS